MSKPYIVYNAITGQIFSTGRSNIPMNQADNRPDMVAMEGLASSLANYIDTSNGEILDKIPMELIVSGNTLLADGTDTVTISDIPVGTKYWNGITSFVIDDGVLEFTTDIPGTYRITFSNVEYIAGEVTLVAT